MRARTDPRATGRPQGCPSVPGSRLPWHSPLPGRRQGSARQGRLSCPPRPRRDDKRGGGVAIGCPHSPERTSLAHHRSAHGQRRDQQEQEDLTVIGIAGYAENRAANAVRVRALPGFKSPSLRRSRPPPWKLRGGGPMRHRAEGCSLGCSCPLPLAHSASPIRSLASFIWSVATCV